MEIGNFEDFMLFLKLVDVHSNTPQLKLGSFAPNGGYCLYSWWYNVTSYQ